METNNKDNLDKLAIIILIPTFILLLVIAMILFFSRKKIINFIYGRRKKDKYPLVYQFWKFIKFKEFDEIIGLLENKIYAPKEPEILMIDEKFEDNVIYVRDNSIYYPSLLVSQKKEVTPISAHYISSKDQSRTYILSEAPSTSNIGQFWSMITKENVRVIVSISYQVGTYNCEEFYEYWNKEKVPKEFGNVEIKCLKVTQISFVSTKLYELEVTNNDIIYQVSLFFVNGWRSGDILESPEDLINLYTMITMKNKTEPVLLHTTSTEPGVRAFMIVYFSVIVECLTNSRDKYNENIYNIMFIIKRIREQKYGGSLSKAELIFLITSIVKYFGKEKILLSDNDYLSFNVNSSDYLGKIKAQESLMNPNIRSFLKFVSNFNIDVVKNLSLFFPLAGYINKKKLVQHIYQFSYVVYLENMKQEDGNNALDPSKCIIRDKNIPTLDSSNIQYYSKGDKEKDIFRGYIHASMFNYKIRKDYRRMILFQAPLIGGIERLYHMFYVCKVSKVIVLASDEELQSKKWIKYFPEKTNDVLTRGKFYMRKISDVYFSDSATNVINYEIGVNGKKDCLPINIVFYHYLNWSDENGPTNLVSFLSLYKLVNKESLEGPIAIHCTDGIGRTGVYALFTYFIETIEAGLPFDFKTGLVKLRNHRYKAIRSIDQYLMVLKAICLYFKEDIDELYPGRQEQIERICDNETKTINDKIDRFINNKSYEPAIRGEVDTRILTTIEFQRRISKSVSGETKSMTKSRNSTSKTKNITRMRPSEDILTNFYSLASYDSNKRIEAIDFISNHADNAKHKKYIIERCISGLTSSRACVRIGYGALLTEMLKKYHGSYALFSLEQIIVEKIDSQHHEVAHSCLDIAKVLLYSAVIKCGKYGDDDSINHVIGKIDEIGGRSQLLKSFINELYFEIISITPGDYYLQEYWNKFKNGDMKDGFNWIKKITHAVTVSEDGKKINKLMKLLFESKDDLKLQLFVENSVAEVISSLFIVRKQHNQVSKVEIKEGMEKIIDKMYKIVLSQKINAENESFVIVVKLLTIVLEFTKNADERQSLSKAIDELKGLAGSDFDSEQLLDIILAILSRESKVFKIVMFYFFSKLVKDFGEAEFEFLIETIAEKNSNLLNNGENEEMEVDDEECEEEDEVSDSEEEVLDEEDSDEDDVDPKLRNALVEALGSAVGNDGDEDVELDDEAMLKLDKAVAAAFKEHLISKNEMKKQLRNQSSIFKAKVIQLLEIITSACFSNDKHIVAINSLNSLVAAVQSLSSEDNNSNVALSIVKLIERIINDCKKVEVSNDVLVEIRQELYPLATKLTCPLAKKICDKVSNFFITLSRSIGADNSSNEIVETVKQCYENKEKPDTLIIPLAPIKKHPENYISTVNELLKIVDEKLDATTTFITFIVLEAAVSVIRKDLVNKDDTDMKKEYKKIAKTFGRIFEKYSSLIEENGKLKRSKLHDIITRFNKNLKKFKLLE
uniref:Tyrosine-protein phosphatase domain-containing protein n=1 Tax=Parastrongyloides trichosuri TaxID=131310 RepID=A0A0N4ZY72_PARTI